MRSQNAFWREWIWASIKPTLMMADAIMEAQQSLLRQMTRFFSDAQQHVMRFPVMISPASARPQAALPAARARDERHAAVPVQGRERPPGNGHIEVSRAEPGTAGHKPVTAPRRRGRPAKSDRPS